MKRIVYIPLFFLTVTGFTQNGIKPSNQCNSNIVKLELEIDYDLPLPISRYNAITSLKPNYIPLNIVRANYPVNFAKVYVPGKYLSAYSLYARKRITLTGTVTKVKQIPGLYIFLQPGSKIPIYYILTPIFENLLSI